MQAGPLGSRNPLPLPPPHLPPPDHTLGTGPAPHTLVRTPHHDPACTRPLALTPALIPPLTRPLTRPLLSLTQSPPLVPHCLWEGA